PTHPPSHSFPTRRSSDLGSWAKLQYAGFEFFPRQTLHSIVGNNQRFNAKLFKTVTQNFSSRFLEVNQGNPGGKFPAARYGRNSGDRKSTRLNSSHGSISY